MPTYDYECSSCGHRFEVFEKAHDGGLKPCPKCGKKKAARQMGAGSGAIFRGSGFHVTDYRKGGSAAAPTKPAETGSAEPAKKKTARHEKKKD